MARWWILLLAGCPEGTVALTVTVVGQGSVHAEGGATLACASDESERVCVEQADRGERVDLVAEPAPDWQFVEWTGDCDGTAPVFTTEPLREDLACTALFTPLTDGDPAVVVTIEGPGAVSSDDGDGFTCGAAETPCTWDTGDAASVSLSHAADSGWTFARWEGDCSGSGLCDLTMDGPKQVTAVFEEDAAADVTPLAVAAGRGHTVLIAEEVIVVVGDNTHGQLGNGTFDSSTTPAVSVNDVGFVSGFTERETGCTVNEDGDLYASGANSSGELGTGDTVDREWPSLILQVRDVDYGTSHSCVVTTDGDVACTGANYQGQLGDGTTTPHESYEVVVGLTGATAVAAGANHSCAVVAGEVWCWGDNDWGQLGTGADQPDSLAPIRLLGIVDAVDVSAATSTTCVVHEGGAVSCWGYNGSGEAGVGSADDSVPTPTEVDLPGPAAQVDVGASTTLARLEDGSVYAWGGNFSGEFGDGTTTGSRTPVASHVVGALHVDVGVRHACAAAADGFWCWGDNEYGQIGDGTTTQRLEPVYLVLPDLQ